MKDNEKQQGRGGVPVSTWFDPARGRGMGLLAMTRASNMHVSQSWRGFAVVGEQ
jgi:hypothetical protein